ncbi:MAG: hypothetical protein IPJ69_01495 [Deltaproteobacteria bacterium]|nr:MAG: hypothetical protein IPJ69_01495 [Deltaproteobacteria bacterium]
MIDIIQVEGVIWVLEEGGRNIFLQDCQDNGIDRMQRFELLDSIRDFSEAITHDQELLEKLIESGFLKKLNKQAKAQQYDLWEVRSDGKPYRVILIRVNPHIVIVAAVDKSKKSQKNAINRGVNRWKEFLKKEKKFP